MELNKEVYQVFSVNICCSSYSIDYMFIGAESKDDLKAHIVSILEEDGEEDDDIYEVLYRFDERVSEKDGLYTDRPYEILSHILYYE